MARLDVPLFPLSTVLFPDSPLTLRIFEPRYLDMVRDCARQGEPFGVNLILAPRSPSDSMGVAAFGTLAHIEDFFTHPDGLLGIGTRGGRRFHVVSTRVRNNGLIMAEIDTLPHASPQQVPAEFGLLVTILDRLVEQFGPPWSKAEQHLYDNAEWVGYRLAELLPLTMDERQHLLEMTHPLMRLKQIEIYLPRFQSE